MPKTNEQVIVTIVAITITLLFLGILFLVMLLNYQQRKRKFHQEKQMLEINFTQQLLQSQLEMQEQTFNTISREIHDNVGQILSLAKVQLNIIDQTGTLDRALLSDARDSVSKAMIDLRDIAKSLNSERVLLLSLPEITGYELQCINRLGTMLTSLHIEGSEQSIDQQKKLIIFRIIQEALQNIFKHSKAKAIHVLFCYESEHLKIQISDDGIGFHPDQISQNDGFGLHNIVNRAALIGGKATISSKPNEGTTITIITPYA